MRTFPSAAYNEEYYSNMAPGTFRHFIESRGRLLIEGRLNDLDFVKLRPGLRLLDLGCGRGELVMFCGSKGICSYGIEYSEAGIRIGKKFLVFFNDEQLKNIHLIKGAVTNLPFPDSYFDRVMSWAVLEHLYQCQLEKCLEETYRVLKPDGIAIFGTHPNEWYQYKAYRVIRPIKQLFIRQRRLPTTAEIRKEFLRSGHVNLQNPISLKSNLEKKGFTCKVHLRHRRDFESKGIVTVLGMVLETIPVVRTFCREDLLAIAAKSQQAMKTFSSMGINRVWTK